jgi:phosphate transport system substrate-binding protein
MNTKKSLLKDKRGVSPAIASLVLVVIAVVAAAGVGVIQNAVNVQSGEQAEAKDLSVQGKIDMQGSTTVLPFALESARTYMDTHPAVEISVSGGGSGHGISMAKENKVDIGMASKSADTEDIIQDGGKGAVLYETEIGKRMIVVIVNDGSGNTIDWNVSTSASADGNINMSDLIGLYETGTQITAGSYNFTTAFQRSDVSGTEEGFAKWIGLTDVDDQLDSDAEERVGNPGVWAAVTESDNSIGFVDYGYVEDTKYAATMNGTAPSADNYDDYESESKALSPKDKALTSMLYYYTYDVPSGAAKAFIDFCLSTAPDEGQDILEDVGLIPLAA